jgi:hypothetical protein
LYAQQKCRFKHMLGVWIVLHVKLMCHLLAVIICRQTRVKFPIFISGEYFHIFFAVLTVNNEPTDAYSTSSLYYVLLITADL